MMIFSVTIGNEIMIVEDTFENVLALVADLTIGLFPITIVPLHKAS